jgi:CubicO group peptidase (beta-lactamase class C family)
VHFVQPPNIRRIGSDGCCSSIFGRNIRGSCNRICRTAGHARLPLQYEPGTRYLYSSAGISTLARIVEVVSGLSFESYLDERLFKPLGMSDTTFWPNGEQ